MEKCTNDDLLDKCYIIQRNEHYDERYFRITRIANEEFVVGTLFSLSTIALEQSIDFNFMTSMKELLDNNVKEITIEEYNDYVEKLSIRLNSLLLIE